MEELVTEQSKTGSRVEWIDILRGILIILMVLGHATGRFNGYIYQFHIGAFFILAGYTEKLKEKSFCAIVYKKVKRLLLPYITMFFTLLPVTILLDRLGYYEILFGSTMPDPWFVITEFFKTGNCYVWWLGACWFLQVLFFTSILAKALTVISNQFYLFYSFVLYLGAYILLVQEKTDGGGKICLVLLAQFCFCFGFTIKEQKILERIDASKYSKYLYGSLFVIGVAILMGNKYTLRYTMDWPAMHFNHFVADFLIITAGFSVVLVLAKALACIKASRALVFLGRNTMGIIMLHFLFMKVALILLYCLNEATSEDLSRIVPTEATGNKWFFFIVVISMGFSVVMYWVLSKIPGYRILLGEGKRELFLGRIEALVERITSYKWWKALWNKWSGIQKNRYIRAIWTICSVAILIVAIAGCVTGGKFWGIGEREYEIDGEIYEDGWIGKQATIRMSSGKQGRIHISLYNANAENVGKQTVIIYEFGDQRKEERVTIAEESTDVVLACAPNTVVTIDFDFRDIARRLSDNDIRDLSLILSEIYAEK